MVFDICQLKKIRKHLGLTQHFLAQKIGISQSMVAKIESGKLDPTYSYVKKIEHALESLSRDHELKAEHIMTKKVLYVKKSATVKEIIHLLTKNGISQVPVIENNIPVGLVTEASLLRVSGKTPLTAEDIMVESPPVIDKGASLSVIKSLLQFYSIVLIKNQKEIIGLVTKSDLLKHLLK